MRKILSTIGLCGALMLLFASPAWSQRTELDAAESVHMEEIEKRIEEVQSFTPSRGWFVGRSTYNYLLFAVSPSERDRWYKSFGIARAPESIKKQFNAALDKLAAAAAVKLPQYQISPSTYNLKTPAEDRLLRGGLENAADVTIFKVGLKQAAWLIDKNDYGIPNSRFRYGMIWLRDPSSDHPYCKIAWINLVQDYAGGGTYGATYASYIDSELAGCPAGK